MKGIRSLIGRAHRSTRCEEDGFLSHAAAARVIPRGPHRLRTQILTLSAASVALIAAPLSAAQSNGLPLLHPALAGAPAWTVVDTNSAQELDAVSCPSASFCMAAGTTIQEWNGSSWGLIAAPNGATGVSCATSSFCMAVGGANSQEAAEDWNGSAWNALSTPVTNPISAVSCVSASFCMAVAGEGAGAALTDVWDGSTWSTVNTAITGSGDSDYFYAVSCVNVDFCVASGYYSPATSQYDYHTLIEEWNGSSWSVVISPNPGPTSSTCTAGCADLRGVSCVTISFCFADGTFSGPSGVETLTEIWDGSNWSIVSSPNTSAAENWLENVDCVDASFCWAVGAGEATASGGFSTLVELWNGTGWSIVNSPNSGTSDNELLGVSCSSTAFCMSTGWVAMNAFHASLAEEYAPPPPSGPPQQLTLVPGNQQMTASWSAPASSSSPITGYGVYAYNSSKFIVASYDVCGTCTAVSFDGLTNGRSYTASVFAITSAGDGSSAFATPVTVGTSTLGNGTTVPVPPCNPDELPTLGNPCVMSGVMALTTGGGPANTAQCVPNRSAAVIELSQRQNGAAETPLSQDLGGIYAVVPGEAPYEDAQSDPATTAWVMLQDNSGTHFAQVGWWQYPPGATGVAPGNEHQWFYEYADGNEYPAGTSGGFEPFYAYKSGYAIPATDQYFSVQRHDDVNGNAEYGLYYNPNNGSSNALLVGVAEIPLTYNLDKGSVAGEVTYEDSQMLATQSSPAVFSDIHLWYDAGDGQGARWRDWGQEIAPPNGIYQPDDSHTGLVNPNPNWWGNVSLFNEQDIWDDC